MPSLANHQSNDFVKCIMLGDAKSGKTGSLVSLVKAGYKLRILDLDNLLDILKNLILKECPDKIDNVEFRSLRDRKKATEDGAGVIVGTPKAFSDAVKMLDRWKYKDDKGTEIDLGVPSEWGPDCILVIDSLSRLCDAAFDYRTPLAPTDRQGNPNMQAVYGDAQDAIEYCLANLTGDNFRTNVLVIAHIQYVVLPDGTQKGFPQGIGQKLSPKIPQYFPTVIRFTNNGGKRTIQTKSDPLIDLSNPKPFEKETSFPAETGLATLFELWKGPLVTAEKPKLRKI